MEMLSGKTAAIPIQVSAPNLSDKSCQLLPERRGEGRHITGDTVPNVESDLMHVTLIIFIGTQ